MVFSFMLPVSRTLLLPVERRLHTNLPIQLLFYAAVSIFPKPAVHFYFSKFFQAFFCCHLHLWPIICSMLYLMSNSFAFSYMVFDNSQRL